MIKKNVSETLIANELSMDDKTYWFDLKDKKYLHQIDTYYYSINIKYDDADFRRMILDLQQMKNQIEKGEYKSIDSRYITSGLTFGIYKFDLELKDQYLILIAENTPNEDTPNVLIQLRSYYLWLHGAYKAIEYSLNDVTELLARYNIEVENVKSNRIDFCWHTNYIQDTEVFFNPKNIAQMRVSRMKEFDMHGRFVGDEGIEHDYLRLGRMTSNNILFRAYLKSKEVVEMGYKPWFFKIWLFHGLINRFDLYCLEECFKKQNWQYLDKARLAFYLEYGESHSIKNRISALLNEQNGTGLNDYDEIKKFADQLVPRVTMILNFEYQSKRKFYNSIEFKNFRNRQGPAAEIFMELDHRKLIIDYLTNETLRFVEKEAEERKERREYAPFWKRLRQTRLVDVVIPPKDIELVRDYSTNMNKELVKLQASRAIATFNVYNGNFETGVYDDCVRLIENLNDNDLYRIKKYKNKKIYQIAAGAKGHHLDEGSSLVLIDTESGEIKK